MEHHTSITSVMVVVGIAFLIPILLQKLKISIIPVVVAEIIAGIIIGKSGFNIIGTDGWLELLSLLGLIYLMFLSGVEIDFKAFKKKENKKGDYPNPFGISIIVFIFMLVLSYGLSYLLKMVGLIDEPFFMTIILSTVSLGVVVPVLKERKIINKPLGQNILLIAVVSDFATMLLFAYFIAMKSGETKRIFLIFVLLIIVFLLYFLVKRVKEGKIYEKLRQGTVQIGTRGVFALILFFVALSERLGAENILGAFLAGIIISLLAPKKEFIHQLDSFGYGFLIPIFFVMVGVKLDMNALFSNKTVLVLIPIVLIFLYVARMLPVFILKKWFNWKETVSSSILLTSTMSLAIVASSVAFDLKIINGALNSAIVLVAIISCFISPIIFNKILPKNEEENELKVLIVGTNGVTHSVSQDLIKESYKVTIAEGDDLKEEILFEKDVIVLGSNRDEINIKIAKKAKEKGIERILVRAEQPENYEEMKKQGFIVFSTLHASRILLKALIEHPTAIQLITQDDNTIQEIEITNTEYDQVKLKELAILNGSLVLRIYRNEMFIIPNGDTLLELGDKMLISGEAEKLKEVRNKIEI